MGGRCDHCSSAGMLCYVCTSSASYHLHMNVHQRRARTAFITDGCVSMFAFQNIPSTHTASP